MGTLQLITVAVGIFLLCLDLVILLNFALVTDKIANFLGHKGSSTNKDFYIFCFTLLLYFALVIFILAMAYFRIKIGLGYL